MNGADALCDTLIASGIDTCFANPGTSEMHIVAALDRRPAMRCILGLFEGVVTGAADGFGRMAGQPAATLLHTGPGLANGLANLHNARRARSPIVNIVGDHASYHLPFDAPLTSDIESLARPMSDWVRRVSGPDDVAVTTTEAVAAARALPGVATMILPGDAAWGDTVAAGPQSVALAPLARVPAGHIEAVAQKLRQHGSRASLLVSGRAARGPALEAAGRIAAKTGARLLGDMFIPRAERGRGRPNLTRVPYPVERAVALLADTDLLVLTGSAAPVAFFAYPGKPSALTQTGTLTLDLCTAADDAEQALKDLALALDAPRAASTAAQAADDVAGEIDYDDHGISLMLAQMLPENAIVVDEALTSVRPFYEISARAMPHDYLMACTGGAIGAGLPLATGAAVASPDRKVLCLQADGSGMYTLQALWTQARESLAVVTVIFANRAYAILQSEMRAVGVNRFGENAEAMLSLDRPALDWVMLARGMGVPGERVETIDALRRALSAGFLSGGPYLIEAVI